MNRNTKNNMPSNTTDFDIVVLGATGLTGKLVVEQLIQINHILTDSLGIKRWAVAGRDAKKLSEVLKQLNAENVEIILADTNDSDSLLRLAARTRVLLNLVGPYTPSAESVISACISSGTSYADLSGELPLLRRVIDRFDASARNAGVQIVQMAGWEAMPADLTTLLACYRASAQNEICSKNSQEGPGAGGDIQNIVVTVDFTRLPEGGVPFNQSVSGGTLASIVAMLKDPGARIIGNASGLLPKISKGLLPQKMHLGGKIYEGKVLEPMVPVAFLNPPIIHRTAALLAAEQNEAYASAKYSEGVESGSVNGLHGKYNYLKAFIQGCLQKTMVGLTRLPLPVRRWLSESIEKRLPKAGTGPSEHYLRDWDWTVKAVATNKNGKTGRATLTGSGHPGYTATAAIIVEVGLSLVNSKRAGCITPALAIGIQNLEQMRMPSLELK
ncbi:trans-acting enoyl reductase family protein [Pedobacter sp. BMA]|uniref:saccharopine dehydrogenase family protein n=1 Tax=Pedobacter sp. BMA TaxID=1663685 RepID=UPI000A679EA7|nr:saccharopine dehydrogenase NADP-binding domain-containing protein [Pedobacter sp. BMA]